jgi:transcriptional regulator with XRE-family HTH domain
MKTRWAARTIPTKMVPTIAVRQMRVERGWTQTRLAEAAGMTQSALARFEAGGTVPTPALLERIAQALDAQLVVRFDQGSSAA